MSRSKKLALVLIFLFVIATASYLSYKHVCKFPVDFVSAEGLDSLEAIEEYILKELVSNNITHLTDVTSYLESLGFSCRNTTLNYRNLQSISPIPALYCSKPAYNPNLYIPDETEAYQCFDVHLTKPDLTITAIFSDDELQEIIADIWRVYL